jgi:transcriptional regulator with XRE-family HTH domain
MTIGERLKAFRKRNLMSCRKAGEYFGVSGSEIERLESGRNKPSFVTEAKWDKLLDMAERKEKA